jgi:hypothetical protein
MNPATFDKPFFEVTLPLMLTIIAGVWAMISTNNRRLDDLVKRLDRIDLRLDRMEQKLDGYDSRIIRLEERTSPLR